MLSPPRLTSLFCPPSPRISVTHFATPGVPWTPLVVVYLDGVVDGALRTVLGKERHRRRSNSSEQQRQLVLKHPRHFASSFRRHQSHDVIAQ